MSTRILVATDGAEGAGGALHLAALLEEERGAEVRVATVVEPIPVFDQGLSFPVPGGGGVSPHAVEERLEAVRARLRDVAGPDRDWSVEVMEGGVARSLAHHARTWGASLLVMGIGEHGAADRILGDEMALQVIRVASVPVLAVHPDARDLPSSFIVAVDFSDFSRRAAGVAIELVGERGRIELFHSGPLPVGVGDEWVRRYRSAVKERLEVLSEELEPPAGVELSITAVTGSPAGEIISRARETGVDAVALGSHGRSFVGRLLLGSVSRKVLRAAPTSVLVIPAGALEPGSDDGGGELA